jgi:hypothetical protein
MWKLGRRGMLTHPHALPLGDRLWNNYPHFPPCRCNVQVRLNESSRCKQNLHKL